MRWGRSKDVAHRDLEAEDVFLAADPDGGVWPKRLDDVVLWLV